MNVSLLGGTQGILGEPWRQGFVSELLSAHPALAAGALRSPWQSVRTLNPREMGGRGVGHAGGDSKCRAPAGLTLQRQELV